MAAALPRGRRTALGVAPPPAAGPGASSAPASTAPVPPMHAPARPQLHAPVPPAPRTRAPSTSPSKRGSAASKQPPHASSSSSATQRARRASSIAPTYSLGTPAWDAPPSVLDQTGSGSPRRESRMLGATRGGGGSGSSVNSGTSNARPGGLRRMALGVRELGHVRDLGAHVQAHAVYLRKETSLRRVREVQRLKARMDRADDEERMDHFHAEALAAVINQGLRSAMVKARVLAKIGHEQELSQLIQQHRDEFLQAVWARRLATKRELRHLFHQGPAIMLRLGDLISVTASDLLLAVDRARSVSLVRDGIAWGLLSQDDVPGVLSRRVFLRAPPPTCPIQVSTSRLAMVLADPSSEPASRGPSSPEPSSDAHSPPQSPTQSTARPPGWATVFATRGFTRGLLGSRPVLLNLLHSALRTAQAARAAGDTTTSFLHVMARALDLLHPGHHVLADAIAYPLYAQGVLKHALTALGYDACLAAPPNPGLASPASHYVDDSIMGGPGPSVAVSSAQTAMKVLSQMADAVERQCRVYFEFSVPEGATATAWRVGVAVAPATGAGPITGTAMGESSPLYPGSDDLSLGLSYDGNVYFMGLPERYVDAGVLGGAKSAPNEVIGGMLVTRTFGLVVDLVAGSLSLVREDRVYPPAFGNGAMHFSEVQREQQAAMLLNCVLVPVFSMYSHQASGASPEMRVNFGLHPFMNSVSATSLNELMVQPVLTATTSLGPNYMNSSTLVDPPASAPFQTAPDVGLLSLSTGSAMGSTLSTDSSSTAPLLRPGAPAGASALSPPAPPVPTALPNGTTSIQDEEERVHLALEKTQSRSLATGDDDRSWSQFPPSVYRRSLAATKIQRAWRVFRGRRWRRELLSAQHRAAVLIQRMARRKLRRVRAAKHHAALVIQRNWRVRMYMSVCLMRLKYRQPVAVLHHAARTIQTKFRDWARFRNSPFASRFRKKLEQIDHAARIIARWWRPLYARLLETKAQHAQIQAATTIQRVWRGACLRAVLRPDIRTRLAGLGAAMVRHRHGLMMVHAALVLQAAWRARRMRRVRAEKLRTRHAAATRIQALWKGYWVRSHAHLRFDYGQSVFLTAVCKNLRAAHFIIKMYRPCGIVCPKRER
ncbi:hypothetical protein GGF31_002647 [Allomyces arbusculus]|nr:hypothetical protein GGF31_002647 [Allomyces arbusculus]